MVHWFINIHPLYHPKDRLKAWICEELVTRYAQKNEEENVAKPSKWMTSEFKKHMKANFKRWGRKEALAEVEAALGRLPIFVLPPPTTSQKSKISKQRSNASKVVTEGGGSH